MIYCSHLLLRQKADKAGIATVMLGTYLPGQVVFCFSVSNRDAL